MSAHNKPPTLIDKCYLGFIKGCRICLYFLFTCCQVIFWPDKIVLYERWCLAVSLVFHWVAWASLSGYICDNTVVCSFIFTSKDSTVKKCPSFPCWWTWYFGPMNLAKAAIFWIFIWMFHTSVSHIAVMAFFLDLFSSCTPPGLKNLLHTATSQPLRLRKKTKFLWPLDHHLYIVSVILSYCFNGNTIMPEKMTLIMHC